MEVSLINKEDLFELFENSTLLPKPSREVSEILELLHNPVELDIDELSNKISRVHNLNELMMKNLNTGYFRSNKEISSIREAIVYLGMQTVQNLLIFFITQQLFSHTPIDKPRVFNMNHYLKHVLGTSVASSMLASELKMGDKYKLFSYGLIHDIGIAVLDTCVPDLLDEITLKLEKGMHQIVAERSLLGGITHAEVGAWICRKWNIREDIINIVAFHHTPFVGQPTNTELKLIHLADVISNQYYEKLLGVNLNPNINKQIMDSLGITDKHIQTIADRLPEEVDKLSNYFSIDI